MYTSLWVKFSSNWVGHLSSVNKVFYWQVSEDQIARARLYLLGRGGGSENLLVEAVTQGTPTGDQRLLRANLVPNAQFVRGRWHRLETLVRCNTGANSDGQLTVWLDGVKVMEHQDVIFVGASETHQWTGFELTPVWGGVSDQLSAAQQLSVDHLYLSRGN